MKLPGEPVALVTLVLPDSAVRPYCRLSAFLHKNHYRCKEILRWFNGFAF